MNKIYKHLICSYKYSKSRFETEEKDKDFIVDLNKKTNFQKHKQNATKILYPLYITIVYGLSESHFDTTLIVPLVRTVRFVVLLE